MLEVEKLISGKFNKYYEPNQSHTADKKRQGTDHSTCFHIYKSNQHTFTTLSKWGSERWKRKDSVVCTKQHPQKTW